jgi:hypothetical protein
MSDQRPPGFTGLELFIIVVCVLIIGFAILMLPAIWNPSPVGGL